jgi:sortase A
MTEDPATLSDPLLPADPTAPSRHGGRRPGTALVVAGAVLVLAAGAWFGGSWLWSRHVHQVGHALVLHHEQRVRAAEVGGTFTCATAGSGASGIAVAGGSSGAAGSGTAAPGSLAGTATAPSTVAEPPSTHPIDPTSAGAVQAVLDVPAIHLTAPIEQGDSDAVLAVAVGHLPQSVWPGAVGTAILAAHDVSYFVDIDQLHLGAAVEVETPCTTYRFSVTGERVVRSGTPLYNSATPTVVLETCWPTDALWYTPDRFLVTATEVAAVPTPAAVDAASSSATRAAANEATPPAVHLPAALVATGLTLATNDIPMGTLTVAGDPPQSWVQSPAPLAVQSSGLEAFIGALRAAEQADTTWWRAAAPGVPLPGVLAGAAITDWHQGLDVTVTTSGTTATSVSLSATVSVSGGPQPGLYALAVSEPIADGSLSVGNWSLTPTAA